MTVCRPRSDRLSSATERLSDVPGNLLGSVRADRPFGLRPARRLGEAGQHGLPTGLAGSDPGDRQHRG
jgi:hypothetical protein